MLGEAHDGMLGGSAGRDVEWSVGRDVEWSEGQSERLEVGDGVEDKAVRGGVGWEEAKMACEITSDAILPI